MLETLGAWGIAKLFVQIVILCLAVYESVRAYKFLRVVEKNRAFLIYMYVLSLVIIAFWALMAISEKTVNRWIILVLGYIMLRSISRKAKPIAVE